ncbi:RNA-guided endonuclease InsQ/TnpB family protein [Candidatus Nitrosotenuis sp. DW1]|uniref:RNA-guided endonuclease InsQ/TnpB family protein n=1 Tax=Candidatus Nitrosotenuis sp. DW1 TaxID=2259672 RepID=UPI0015CCDB1E|nr:RNA-guided endonuclease TnpB family protein [Candidatus Nitrosotenuis sp. DW1]QLH09673.1 transposase [Candidatus Nitrosotenuis sp. DW1]
MQRTFKFRLYPNVGQSQKLQNNLAVCRWIYNKMIEKINKEGFQSRNDLNYFLTDLKEREPWLYSCHSKMLQMISTQIDGAQKALIQLRKNGNKTGTLRFSKHDEFQVFTYNQSGFDITRIGNTDLLYLSKIGSVQIRIHRNIPQDIKQITITKSKSGKWYVCITCNAVTVLPKISLAKSVGIDVGIKNFAYDSDGFVTPNPLNLQKMLKPLARMQRKIARRQMGSQNRKKALKFYQIIHERIKNRRKDFLHKISAQYAKKYDVVFVERLQKLNMVKNHKLAQKILDSGWGTFTNMLDYKCMLIEVPAKNTTIDCSRCGNKVPKSLAVRIHRCDRCGLVIGRDHNAAINILKKGLNIFNIKLPQELREVTPVEIQNGSVKQEETTWLVR